MPNKGDKPDALAEVEEIARRFLEGELPLEEAARDIARRLPTDEPWALTWTNYTPPKDVARLRPLFSRAAQLWNEILDDNLQ